MKITDKMIKELICTKCAEDYPECRSFKLCKQQLVQKGYEVEEPKSKLEEVIDLVDSMIKKAEYLKDGGSEKRHLEKIKYLYGQVIEELQNQLQEYEYKITTKAFADNLK